MASADPRTWLDRAFGAAFSVLAGAIALFIAVKLIESIWLILATVLALAVLVVIAILVFRGRSDRGW